MKKHLLATLENSKNYTLAVAEAMPGNAYHTRPASGVLDFGELIHHIAYGIHWWEENHIKGKKLAWEPPALTNGKKEAIAVLNKAYSSLKETVEKSQLDDEIINGFHATLDHITHHRGQAVTYLRYNGVTPPEYSY